MNNYIFNERELEKINELKAICDDLNLNMGTIRNNDEEKAPDFYVSNTYFDIYEDYAIEETTLFLLKRFKENNDKIGIKKIKEHLQALNFYNK